MSKKELNADNHDLQRQLQEAQETLKAIRTGAIDALVVEGPEGDQIYSLKGAEEPYRVMVETMNKGAATFSPEGDILYCNRRFAELVKKPLKEVIGSSVQRFIAPEYREKFQNELAESTRAPVRSKIDLLLADNSKVPIQYSTCSLKGDRVEAIVVIFTNLTEIMVATENLKKTEAELIENRTRLEERKRSVELLQTVVKALPDGMLMVKRDGSIALANSQAEIIFGYETGALLGQSIDLLVPDCVRAQKPDFLARLFTGSYPRQAAHGRDCYGLRRNGSLVPIEMNINLPRFENDEFILVSVTDVAERKDAEARLRSQAELMDLTHDTIMVRKLDGTITYWNHGAQQMYGFDRSQALGQKAHELLKTQFPEAYEQIVYEFLICEQWNGELTNTTADGRRICVSSRWALKKDQQGNPLEIMDINHDITEHKRAEKLMRARDLAIEASGMKSAFLANISHELRTPLSGILGMNEMLLQSRLATDQRDCALMVHSSAQTMLALVNDILDVARIESGKTIIESVPFDLRYLAEKVIRVIAPAAFGKKLAIVNSIDADVPQHLMGDPLKLQQILLNLIGNAVKFTKQGEVQLSVSVLNEDEDRILLKFLVSDTGIGITEQERKFLFIPFSQVDSSSTRRYGGAGLGLTICKRLVELMGGEISFSSKKNEGSSFWFTIPYLKATIHQTEDPVKQPEAKDLPITSKNTILVVEDNQVMQELLKMQLASLGQSCEIVTTAEEGLERLEGRAYSLILMDCQLPYMDGFEASRRIRMQEALTSRHIPIIAMTAAAMKGESEKCLATGMDDYISKPYTLDQLRQKLTVWLSEKAPRAAKDS